MQQNKVKQGDPDKTTQATRGEKHLWGYNRERTRTTNDMRNKNDILITQLQQIWHQHQVH